MFVAASVVMLASCGDKTEDYKMGTYGYDLKFFEKYDIETVELSSPDGTAKVVLAPQYQGRVMTSTASGNSGDSYGWINYKLIESGVVSPQFNPIGGEERFWLGPEGGEFSYYFKQGDEQLFENWIVPAVIDTERYDITTQSAQSVTFSKVAELDNVHGTHFSIGIERKVSMLSRDSVSQLLGVKIPDAMNFVAYESCNVITNRGAEAWRKEGGVPSIWMLSMFNPTPTTTVFIPYNTEADGVVVNDEYFGKIPQERLIIDNGMMYFKIDGLCRGKLGVPKARAKELCGSYDSEKKVLTLLWYSIPAGESSYVNGQWGKQADAFNGDVINAYNDGPVADGSIMGPFYEIETSSPGAELSVGGSMSHTQRVVHIQGDDSDIDAIVRTLFGVKLTDIASRFQ